MASKPSGSQTLREAKTKDTSPTLWEGRVRLGAFWALHRGTVGDNRSHAHHALQLTAADKALCVRFGAKPITEPGVFIASMRRHSLKPMHDAVNLYVDATSAVGRWLARLFASRSDRLDVREVSTLRQLDPATADDDAVISCLRQLAATGIGIARPLDARLTRALALLERALEQPLSLRRIAKDVRLSEGRLSRLFHSELGLPYRPYRRWRRVQQAFLLLQDGANLTDAAIGAGFSDSAHFSRTIQNVFGVRPSAIAPLLQTRTTDSFKR